MPAILSLASCALIAGVKDGQLAEDAGVAQVDAGSPTLPGDEVRPTPFVPPADTGAGCGNLSSDPGNCGACGRACAAGFTCTEGRCGNEVAKVTVGGAHMCALLRDGSAWCWGGNTYGELGVGVAVQSRAEARKVLSDVVDVSAGISFTCAVRRSGELFCWGANDVGQLGHSGGDLTCAGGGACNPSPLPVAGLANVADVHVGLGVACARTTAGAVFCWGSSARGLLGEGAADATRAAPVAIVGAEAGVKEVSMPLVSQHACVRRADDAIACWGQNARGELGVPPGTDEETLTEGTETITISRRLRPLPAAPSGARWVDVRAAFRATCALASNDQLFCLGSSAYGLLGNGTSDDAPHPTFSIVPELARARALEGSHTQVCALLEGGTASCWGTAFWGGAGSTVTGVGCVAGPTGCFVSPRPVASLADAVALASGGESAAAIRSDGTVWTWGANLEGRLGHPAGTSNDLECPVEKRPCNPIPTRVDSLPRRGGAP